MNSNNPWLQIPRMTLDDSHYGEVQPQYDVIIVGAGIAGASAAFKFAEAGYRVAVLEKEAQAAQAGSGNLQGMLYLKLSPNTPEQNELLLAGFKETLSLLMLLTERKLLIKGEDWDDCGLIQLSKSEKDYVKQQALAEMYPQALLYYVDQKAASSIAGVALSAGGLFFPTSGWVSPRKFVEALLMHPNITLKFEHEVIKLHNQQRSQTTPQWQVDTVQCCYSTKLVVLAMADQVRCLTQCQSFPFTVVRGQTTSAIGDCHLLTVVSGEGYIAPAKNDHGIIKTTFGATFHRHQPAGAPTEAEHIENIEMLRSSSAELVERLGLVKLETGFQVSQLEGRASTRASAMGSIPIVGPIAKREEFLEKFKALRLDSKASVVAGVPWELGLYLSTAHGSRGMVTAMISAELLLQMSNMDHSDSSIGTTCSQKLISALHPNRFYYRELRFNQ